MGEIGIPRREYLYELTHVDILLIERGYDRRYRHPWSIARWTAYNIMMAQVGSEGMRKAGIHYAADLLHFPWEGDTPEDDSPASPVSAKEAERLRQMMREENARAETAQQM